VARGQIADLCARSCRLLSRPDPTPSLTRRAADEPIFSQCTIIEAAAARVSPVDHSRKQKHLALYSGEGMAGSEGGVASFSLGACIYLHSVVGAGWLLPILTYSVAPKGNNFTECLSDENVRSCQNFQRRGSTLLKGGEDNKLSLDGGCWQDALPLNRKYANFGKCV